MDTYSDLPAVAGHQEPVTNPWKTKALIAEVFCIGGWGFLQANIQHICFLQILHVLHWVDSLCLLFLVSQSLQYDVRTTTLLCWGYVWY
jgi:hypothetical protein